MISETTCYAGQCDNCGEVFEDYSLGYSLFVTESDVQEHMDNSDWYTGHTDPDHEGKHYCPKCFTEHPDLDDKIIVDASRQNASKEQEGGVS